MKRLIVSIILSVICSGSYGAELETFAGLGLFIPKKIEIVNVTDSSDPDMYSQYKYKAEEAPGLVLGVILTDRLKSLIYYYKTGLKKESEFEYETIGISLDYIFWNFGKDPHQGFYISVGTNYDSFDDKTDTYGSASTFGVLLKLGIEYRIDNYLFDAGFCHNSSDESFSNVDYEGNDVTGEFWGPGVYYITFNYIF